jgi:hypothetical protein
MLSQGSCVLAYRVFLSLLHSGIEEEEDNTYFFLDTISGWSRRVQEKSQIFLAMTYTWCPSSGNICSKSVIVHQGRAVGNVV